MGEEGRETTILLLKKTHSLLCIMIERGIKEIIDQLLFLVNKCLQFLGLFLSYKISFMGFMNDVKLLRYIIIQFAFLLLLCL